MLLLIGCFTDDGLPERLKDDADLEVVTAPEPSQPFLSRNKKWTIVGIILFLVIAGAVGGAVGGVMAKKSGLGSQAPVDSPTVNQKTDGNSTASNLKTQLLATERVGSAVFLDWAPYDDANGGYGLRSIHTFYQTPDGWIRWKVFNEDKASLFGAAKFGNYTGWPSDEGIIINSIKARPRSSIGIAQAKYYGYKRPSGYIQDSRPPVEKVWAMSFVLGTGSSCNSLFLKRRT